MVLIANFPASNIWCELATLDFHQKSGSDFEDIIFELRLDLHSGV